MNIEPMTAHERMDVRNRLKEAEQVVKAGSDDPFVCNLIEAAHDFLEDSNGKRGMRDFVIAHVEFIENLAGIRKPSNG